MPTQNTVTIISDDEVATGATFQVALWTVGNEDSIMLVGAISVDSEAAIRMLADEVDELLNLCASPVFAAVGQFYRQFEAAGDEDVLEILKEGRNKASMKRQVKL